MGPPVPLSTLRPLDATLSVIVPKTPDELVPAEADDKGVN
jgi:hypothetical protein